MSNVKRLYSRYYCTRDPRHRVFPFDRFDLEAGVEAPVPGKSGEQVLLSTLNSNIEPGMPKWGYCWACEMTVQCQRKTQHQVRLEYYSRRDVVTRRTITAVERGKAKAQPKPKRRAS